MGHSIREEFRSYAGLFSELSLLSYWSCASPWSHGTMQKSHLHSCREWWVGSISCILETSVELQLNELMRKGTVCLFLSATLSFIVNISLSQCVAVYSWHWTTLSWLCWSSIWCLYIHYRPGWITCISL